MEINSETPTKRLLAAIQYGQIAEAKLAIKDGAELDENEGTKRLKTLLARLIVKTGI